MQDNQLWALLISVINTGLTARGITATVQQSYQPTQQGVQTGPSVILSNVTAKRYGSPNNKSVPATGDTATQTESYIVERTIQVGALSIQNPKKPGRTAFDIVDAVSAIMQSEATRNTLRAAGVGIIRIQDIRTPYFLDDKNLHESDPSFDFTVNYTQSNSATVPTVVGYDYGIHPV